MQPSPRIAAGSLLLAFFVGAVSAQEVASPRSDGFDFTGLDVVTRIVEQTYPLNSAPLVSIVNRFGPVSIETWDDPVVHLAITIRVGAPTEQEAVRTAQLIDVVSTHEKDRLDVQTEFPPADDETKGGYSVGYEVHVPHDTSLMLENAFGDLQVIGVRGGTTIDSRYGVIDLSDLAGPVRVRARGEFHLTARRLEEGGHFFLRGTQASFRDIEGTLQISNYLGSVTLHPLQVELADVVTESGSIHVHLPDGPKPHIEARADFGRIESEVELERSAWGRSALATHREPNAAQRIAVQAAFGDVHIYRPPALAPLSESNEESELVQDEISKILDWEPKQIIRIDAAPGDVVVQGTADNQVSVVATRRVRVQDVSNARLALEGLQLRIENGPEAIRVLTVVREDMDALGSRTYGVDLTIKCPANAALEIYTDDGATRLSQLSGRVQVEQGIGALSGSALSGTARLVAFRGSVTVTDSSGTISLSATEGDARVERVSGDVSIDVQDGRTVVDSPGGSLEVRATGGDVRIVALEGVQGDYDVRAEQGTISLVTPETSSATFFLNSEQGRVQSAFPVTGTMERGEYRFQGRLNDGRYRVLLETKGGDIRVD